MNIRTFGKNTIVYVVSNLAIRLTSFLLIPIYTRYLLSNDYGLLVTLLITVQIMSIFMSLQMSPAFIRFCKEFESKKLIGQLLGSSIVVIIIGCILVSGFCILVLPLFFESFIHREGPIITLIALSCGVAVFQSLCMHVMSYYRAKNDALKYTLFSISTAILIILLTIILLVILQQGIPGVLIAQCTSYGIIGIFISLKIYQTVKPRVSLSTIQHLLRFGFPLIFSATGWFIMTSSDRYFLAHFAGLSITGIYDLGYKIASILLLLVVMPFQMAYGPFTFAILGKPDIKERLARIFVYLSSALLLVGLCITFLSRDLVGLMAPKEYSQAYLVSICILPAAAMTGIYYWASALIHIVKKTYIIGVITTFAAGLNLSMNYILVPTIGWPGAAIATNSSFLFASAGTFIIGMRLFPVPLGSELAISFRSIGSAISRFSKSIILLARILYIRLLRWFTYAIYITTRSRRQKKQKKFSRSKVKKVLVWAVGDGLGDAVNSIPMIRALKIKFNKPFLTIICLNKAPSSVYSALPEVDEVIHPPLSVLNSRILNKDLLKKIRSKHYDLMIQDPISWPPLLPSSLFYSFLSKIPYKVGYFDISTALFNTWILFPNSKEHTSEMKLRLIEEILGEPVTSDQSFPISEQLRFWAKESINSTLMFQRLPLVAFHVCTNNKFVPKIWSLDKFIALGSKLVTTYNARIILVGGKEESAQGREILEILGENATNFIGCNVKETAAILEQCDLFVGNDSGPMHISASVGTPVIALFGPTEYIRCRPYGVKNKIIRTAFSCSPCWCWLYNYERHVYLRRKRENCFPAECMEAIKVEDVFSACATFFSEASAVEVNSNQGDGGKKRILSIPRCELESHNKSKNTKKNNASKDPEISVVIITYNRLKTLKMALDSIIHQETGGEFSFEILVVDDASTDGTRDFLSDLTKTTNIPIRYFSEEGRGIPYARNKGIKEAQGEWIVFFDDDQIAETNWLKELREVALRKGAYIVGGPRYLNLTQDQMMQIGPICRKILGETNHGLEIHKKTLKTLPTTGNMMIKHKVFNTVGLFDTTMSRGGTDIDFARRALAAGFESWYSPVAVVQHIISSHRLTEDYFKWTSFRWGINIAFLDYKNWGRLKMMLACIARIGQAFFINIPCLFFCYLKCNRPGILDRKCLLWRTLAYTRESLFLIAPKTFPQKRFFDTLEFRRERSSFERIQGHLTR